MPAFSIFRQMTSWCRLVALLATICSCRTTAEQTPSPSAPFYDLSTVQEVRLQILPSHRKQLLQSLPSRVYVPATFQWHDHVIGNVGVRFKGNSSSSPNQRHKRSYLVKFGEYEKGTRFLGLRRVALDNAVQFGSVFSEPLITEILRDLGLHASRCNFAKLYVNNEYQGVYVNVERIDESFIQSRFGKPLGPLFKGEGGPGGNLASIGEDTTAYRKSFEAKSDAAEEAYGDLVEFIQSVSSLVDAADPPVLEQVMALDDFIETMAVMLLSGAFDQLTGWNPHNYYLYQNPTDARWHYLTSDLDVGFADHAFGQIPVIDGWNAAWPIAGGPPRPLLEKIISNPSLLTRYRSEADQILETYFRPEIIHGRLDALYQLIHDALDDDPYPAARITVPGDQGWDDIVSSMKLFMSRRYQTARDQLDQPGQRPAPVDNHPAPRPNPRGQPQPGELAGRPTELRVVARDRRMIHLQWKNNAINEHAHIVQRTSGGDETRFFNHIGKASPNVTEAFDQNIDPNATYRYRVYAVYGTPNGPAGTRTSNVIESAPTPPKN